MGHAGALRNSSYYCGMQAWIDWLNKWLPTWEHKISVGGVALMVGLVTYLLAMGYVSGEEFRLGPHGKQYMAISEAPFSFTVEYNVGYRRLAPIVGYLLGLRGERFLWLVISAAIALPASLYFHLRRARQVEAATALGLTWLIGSSSVMVIHFIARGYVDPVYYLCVLWAFLLVERSRWAWLPMLLAPLVHECTLALWPAWVLWRRMYYRHQQKPQALGWLEGLLVLLPWVLWRWLADQLMFANYNLAFYLSLDNLRNMVQHQVPYYAIGALFALKFAWALPARALRLYLDQRDRRRFLAMWILLLGVAAQALVALDLGRLFSLAFPGVIVAAIDLSRAQPPDQPHTLTAWIWWLWLAGLPLLTYYVAGPQVIPLLPWPLRALEAALGATGG